VIIGGKEGHKLTYASSQNPQKQRPNKAEKFTALI